MMRKMGKYLLVCFQVKRVVIAFCSIFTHDAAVIMVNVVEEKRGFS